MKRATDIGLFQKKSKQGRRGLSIHFDIHRSFSLVKTNLTFRLLQNLLQNLFQQKIHIKVNIFPRLSISLFVLAVMLVMSVRLANIWQPEQLNTLVRIRNLTNINTLFHPMIV